MSLVVLFLSGFFVVVVVVVVCLFVLFCFVLFCVFFFVFCFFFFFVLGSPTLSLGFTILGEIFYLTSFLPYLFFVLFFLSNQ